MSGTARGDLCVPIWPGFERTSRTLRSSRQPPANINSGASTVVRSQSELLSSLEKEIPFEASAYAATRRC